MRVEVKAFCFFVAMVFCAWHAMGQKNKTFQRSYGGQYASNSYSIIVLPDKGFILSGTTDDYSVSGIRNILLIRTDSTGKEIWSRSYGGPKYESINGISVENVDLVLTPEADIAVCASTNSYSSGQDDIYLFEIDLNGMEKWSRTFGGPYEDYGMSVLNDVRGGFIITGGTCSDASDNSDIFLLKTDKNGNLVWAKTYGIPMADEVGYKVIAARDGGYLICGSSYISFILDRSDEVIMKVDVNGNMLWSKVYGTSSIYSSCEATTIVELPDRSIYVGGIESDTLYDKNPVGIITKLDKSGNLIWAKTYDSTSHSAIGTLLYDSTHKWFNTSITLSDQQTGIMRIDTAGHFIFEKFFAANILKYIWDSGHDDIIQLPSGGFMSLLTYYNSQAHQGPDIYLVKSDTAANPGPCFLSGAALHPFLLTSFLADHSYMLPTQAYNPNIDTGLAVFVNDIRDSVLCQPFIADFRSRNLCFGQNVQFIDSSGSNPITWLWDFGDTASTSKTSTSQNPGHLFSAPGSFKVKLVAGNGAGETDSIIKTIIVRRSPKHQALTTLTICHGEFAELELHGLGGDTINWGIPFELNDSAIPVKPANDTLIIAKVTSPYGCVDFDSFSVKYRTNIIDLGHDTTLCPGEVMLFKATGLRGTKFLWSNGSSDSVLFVSKPGKYSVKVLSGNCEYDGAVNIYYISFPDKVLPQDTVLCDGYSIHIDLNNYSDTMIWQDGNQNHVYDISAGGVYSVVLKNGCGQKKYTFTVRDSDCACTVFVPNAFTPGNDGHNDQFKSVSACVPVSFQLQVFNRWGERVFQSNDIQEGWDGKFHGAVCLDGVYFWQIYAKYPAAAAKLLYGTLSLERK